MMVGILHLGQDDDHVSVDGGQRSSRCGEDACISSGLDFEGIEQR